MDPNKNCPNCQGKGEPESQFSYKTYQYEIIGTKDCPVCHGDFDTVYRYAERLLLQNSGKSTTGMTSDDIDLAFISEDSLRYNRILSWLWNNPPCSGQNSNGFPVGSQPIQSKSFADLFHFLPCRSADKTVKQLPVNHEIIPWFECKVRALLPCWDKVHKVIRKQSNIPVLDYVKLSDLDDGLSLTSTDLNQWGEAWLPAKVFSRYATLLPSKRILQILKSCPKTGSIQFGLTPGEIETQTITIVYGNCLWKVPVIGTENFPCRLSHNSATEAA